MVSLKKFIPLEFAANNYLLYDDILKKAILIDCAGSDEEIFKFIDENGLNLEYILITHAHFDHCLSLKAFKNKYPDVKAFLPLKDIGLYKLIPGQCALFGRPMIDLIEFDGYVEEGFKINFGDNVIETIETPGHSSGSVCYLTGDILFSGDTLFFEEIGRCDLPTGSFSEIKHSIKEKLFNLDENVKVFPGHGDNTDIGHEKIYNAYFGKNARY